MKSVAIIGACITGLTAAFCLQRKGVPSRLIEADALKNFFRNEQSHIAGQPGFAGFHRRR